MGEQEFVRNRIFECLHLLYENMKSFRYERIRQLTFYPSEGCISALLKSSHNFCTS